MKQQAGTCRQCGRKIALTADAARGARAGNYGVSVVGPGMLRPHKCSHGNWCHECAEEGNRG